MRTDMMKLFTFAPCLLLLSTASRVWQDCTDGSSTDGVQVLQQISDFEVSTVAKVVAHGDTRMLVIDKAGDFSVPCKYTWWMEHEVQGTALCKETLGKSDAGSFLEARQAVQKCPVCTPRVNDMVKNSGYFQSMAAFATLTPDGQLRSSDRVLIIGLGAGVLPSWLLARTNANVDVVDISEAVVELSPCFGLQAGPRLGLHVADGRKFLSTSADVSYNTIVLDAFDNAASMPACLRTIEFFKLVSLRLSEEGVLLLNLLKCGTDADATSCGTFQNSMIASVQAVFPSLYLAKASGSAGSQSVLIAQKKPSQDTSADKIPEDVQSWFKEADVHALPKISESQPFRDSMEC